MNEHEETRQTSYALKEFLPYVHSGGGLWVTNLYHYLGILVAWIAARIGVGPNALTVTSGLLTACGGGLLVFFDQTWAIASASFTLCALAYAFDCSDGQLARATNQGSKLGAWLDHTVDCGKIVFLNGCLGWVAVNNVGESELPLWLAYSVPVINAGATLVYFFGWNYKVQLVGNDLVGRQATASSAKLALLKLPLHLTDFGLFLFLWFALPYPKFYLLSYAMITLVNVIVFSGYLAVSALALSRDCGPEK